MNEDLGRLLPSRRGHFRLESGHHGDLWLELELLYLRPAPVLELAAALARRISQHRVEVVCGPLIEGAFVALTVASKLEVEFCYSERSMPAQSESLYPVEYRIPRGLRGQVRGRRVAIVNDVINAGSAVRGTFADLEACGAKPVAFGALLVLGSSASRFASEKNIPLESLAFLENAVWAPSECPLCASGVPLEDPAGADRNRSNRA